MTALAKQMDVSFHTVARRLDKLLSDETIRIVGTVDIEKIGPLVGVIVCLQLEPKTTETVIDKLSKHPSVLAIERTMGNFDILVYMWFLSKKDLSEFISFSLPKMPEIIMCETLVELNQLKGGLTRLSPYFIDSEYRDLISLLQQDGRRSNASIGAALGISPQAVGYQIRHLLASGKVRIRIYDNSGRPELRSGAQARICVEFSKLHSAVEELAANPKVTAVNVYAGHYPIVARIHAESTEELSDFVATHINSIKGVREVEYSLILETRSFYEQRHREYWNGENRPEQAISQATKRSGWRH